MRDAIHRLRRWLSEFARDHIKPDPSAPGIRPEVGVLAFDEARWHGTYQGEVAMPPLTEGTDATAFALLMTASWMGRHAPQQGMDALPFKTGAFGYRVAYEVEFEPLASSDAVLPADPAQIKSLIEALLNAAAEDEPVERPEADPHHTGGVVIPMHRGGEE